MLINELKTFICIADCGSFGKAAEKLYISTTAVMKQMNALEAYTGLSLMTRSNRGVRLTPAGESLYKDAKFLLDYAQKSLARAKKASENDRRIIRIGTSMLNPCKPFMDLYYRAGNIFSQYKLQVVPFDDNHENILSIIDRIGENLDFIVGVCDSAIWLSKCNIFTLGSFKKCISVPYYHRLANRSEIEVSDLYGETLMMVSRGDSETNDRIRDYIEKKHPQIHIEDVGHFYDINVFNRCEQTGNVLLNLECWQDIHPALVSIPVNWDYTIPYGLLYPLQPSEDIKRFLEIVKRSI